MKTFSLEEDGETGIYCPRCGIDSEEGACDHLYLHHTGQMDEPEYDRDNIIKSYESQDQLGLMEFLDSKLGEDYLCFYLYIPAPSDFDAFYVYELS